MGDTPQSHNSYGAKEKGKCEHQQTMENEIRLFHTQSKSREADVVRIKEKQQHKYHTGFKNTTFNRIGYTLDASDGSTGGDGRNSHQEPMVEQERNPKLTRNTWRN